MAPPLRTTTVVVAGILALCCVVTIHVNDETIRAEATVVREADGMMFEEDDNDSDDLSDADRQLIAAAGESDDEVKPIKYSELSGVRNHNDLKRNNVQEDAEDELSKDDEDLIHAANRVPRNAPWDHKKVKKVAKKVKKAHTSAKDELSDDELHLIHAADRVPTRSAPWKAAHKAAHKKVKKVHHAVAVKVEEEPEDMEDMEVAKPKQHDSDSDDLSPDMEALINAAAHHKKGDAPVPTTFKRHSMRKQHKIKMTVPKRVAHAAVPVPVAKKHRDISVKNIQTEIETRMKTRLAKKPVHHVHFAKKSSHMMSDGEKKLRQSDDDLTPEERKLISAASHEDPRKMRRARLQARAEDPSMGMIEEKLRASKRAVRVQQRPAQPDKSVMKRAMEKITKSAAQKAVMAATTTLPELSTPVVHKMAAPAVKAAPAIPTFDGSKMNSARAIVYGTKADLPALHVQPDYADHGESDEKEPTFKTVVQARRHEQQALKAKFQSLEQESSKASQESWEQRLADADKKAAMMAHNQLVPVSSLAAAQGNFLRHKIATEYHYGAPTVAAVPMSTDDVPATVAARATDPMDAHAFIRGEMALP